jgi:hypothetical protein
MRSLALLAALVLVATGCRPAGKTVPAGVGTAPAKTTYSREELRTMVMGKTAEEVIALIGKPEKTSESEPGSMMMQYGDIAIDPGTGKARGAFLHLRKGKVNSVGF